MAVEVIVPEEYMGDVIGDLNTRRGRIEGMELRGSTQVIKSYVPLAEMFGYASGIALADAGAAAATPCTFNGYEEAPAKVQEEIVNRVTGKVVR